jgi:hypothetical protein
MLWYTSDPNLAFQESLLLDSIIAIRLFATKIVITLRTIQVTF